MANNTTINSELFTNLLAEAQFAAYENSIARQIVLVQTVLENQPEQGEGEEEAPTE